MGRYLELLLYFAILICTVNAKAAKVRSYSELHNCELEKDLVEEIASYNTVVVDIVDYLVTGPFKGRLYNDLVEVTSKMEYHKILAIIIVNYLTSSHSRVVINKYDQVDCLITEELQREISSYQNVTEVILNFVLNGGFKQRTYHELQKFVDKFGPRLSGSETLEKAIDYMINITHNEDINDVVTEEVTVPHWVRGHESAVMIEPRHKNISLLGLGYSVSTPPEGITAEVIVVKSFAELEALSDDVVKGKIVVYDETYTTYYETVAYRERGATKASTKGAVASLMRSIAPFSIYSPHTGMQSYDNNVTKIPTAAITLEDADLISRFYDNKQKVVLSLKMFSTLNNSTSRNTIIDLKGTQQPEKLVIVSGHIDSWDVGQGAMDDGGGMIISWAVPVILKQLNLNPKRTIRSILWTGEELGLVGAFAYADKHKADNANINIALESDEGTFKPTGLAMSGTPKARCIVAEVLKLFSSINATILREENYPGSDIITLVSQGVPGAGLLNKNEKYFWFHHSEGDTMNVENPDELDLCAAFWAAVSYIIADLTVDIPRT